jgi:UPF0716 protein FxsA
MPFLLFLAIPLIEIALFITVGGWISMWPTLALVVLTALLGSVLVRFQGLDAIRRLQSSLETLQDPTEPLGHGVLILIAGFLLITPGFFTDTLGFLLLVPAVRRLVIAHALSKFQPGASHRNEEWRGSSVILEADYHEVTDDDPNAPGKGTPGTRSGWTRP